MPRGAPDYSNVRAYGPVHRLDDMAELAARLGSPNTHDRRGRVVMLETFEHGLGGWDATGYGTGSSIVPTPDVFRSGPFGLKMVAGSDGASAAKIVRRVPYPELSKFGVEISFMIEAHTYYIDVVLSRMDGTDEHQFYVRYDNTALEIQVKDTDGNFETVWEDIDLGSTRPVFQTVKVVADFETDYFVRVQVNDEQVSLPTYPAYIFANPDNSHARVDVKLWGEAAYNGFSYFDDIILTQAEP